MAGVLSRGRFSGRGFEVEGPVDEVIAREHGENIVGPQAVVAERIVERYFIITRFGVDEYPLALLDVDRQARARKYGRPGPHDGRFRRRRCRRA